MVLRICASASSSALAPSCCFSASTILRCSSFELTALSCTASVKVLNENWHEARDMLQEMFEDAVLLGCGKEAFRAEFRRLIDGLDCDYKELLQPVEAKGVKGD